MLKKYTEKSAPSNELKLSPNEEVVNAILNYSKSVEVKATKKSKSKILIHLN
ncbi:MAG: hypothetical protein MK066_06905 [Crocinitomicaceae bacterium]|nr:hypothetical protein [Crocinitomicaceae bacterium]